MSYTSRWLRALENSAHRGELNSIFQLYLLYSKGTSEFKANPKKSDDYFKRIVDFLESNENEHSPTNKFMLSEVNLVNFRRFENIKIRFEKDITVIIGGNGAGKTTIIDAIAKVLSWIVSGIEKEAKNGSPIKYPEINNSDNCFFSDVNALFEFGGRTKVNGTVSRSKVGYLEKRDSNVIELKTIANVWRVINSTRTINLPVFLCYSVARSHPIRNVPQIVRGLRGLNGMRQSRFDAYAGALDGPGKFENFIEWFIEIHKQTSGRDGGYDLDALESQVKKLELLSKNDPDFIELYEQKNLELNRARHRVQSSEIESILRQKRMVVGAVVQVVPSIEDIWVETSSGIDEIKVRNDSSIVGLSQISDGQRVLLSLTADLARRLVMLNPNLSNPLEGQGIVLIDEIELHLHPAWQQSVVLSLKVTFPNVQFILTTHSPQILSTVDKRCIRQFSFDENGHWQTNTPEFQTKGVTSADILARIMNTNSIPNIPEARLVDDFSRLLSLKKMSEALLVYKDIVTHFGEEHPVTYDCDNQIKIYQMKEMIKKRKDSEVGNEKNK